MSKRVTYAFFPAGWVWIAFGLARPSLLKWIIDILTRVSKGLFKLKDFDSAVRI